MRQWIAAAALALPLAACEQGAPEAEVTNIEVPDGGYAERIRTMPEGQRNGVFIRAIRDGGQDCQGVESSAFAGEINGAPAWTAVCQGGTTWTIAIGKDGIAQVMNTQELEALKERTGQ